MLLESQQIIMTLTCIVHDLYSAYRIELRGTSGIFRYTIGVVNRGKVRMCETGSAYPRYSTFAMVWGWLWPVC